VGSPGARLLVELGAVIFGLGVLGRLARRIGLSPIPLYLLAGLAFGKGGLLPLTTSEEFLSEGAQIGVILLLLLLGLEYSAGELVSNLRAQAPVGALNVVLNMTPGVVVGLLLGWSPVAALAMGGVTYASSSGIAAKLLADLGRIGNRETPVVLSLLVLEDLSMAVYLPILTALLAGVGLLGGSLALVVALGALGVALVVALRFGGAINRLVFSPDDEVLLLRVFGLALLVAGIAEQLQVSAAVGAFLIGIALSGRVAEGARELLSPLRDLFAAVFFVFFGLRTDPSAIPPVLLIAALLALVTALTKGATGWWAARRAGVGRLGRVRAGTVIIARGEFNIVIAGLAAAVEPALGPLAAAYVLIMAVGGPLIARVAEPVATLFGAAPGRRAAAAGRALIGAAGRERPER
jgi:monovalent cation:H+ antiporter-2, CPA2 family